MPNVPSRACLKFLMRFSDITWGVFETSDKTSNTPKLSDWWEIDGFKRKNTITLKQPQTVNVGCPSSNTALLRQGRRPLYWSAVRVLLVTEYVLYFHTFVIVFAPLHLGEACRLYFSKMDFGVYINLQAINTAPMNEQMLLKYINILVIKYSLVIN